MARPKKENADYFSHDTNMRSNRKIIALRSKFWLSWYAIYCMLLEHIASCDFFISKRDDIEKEILAGDFWVSVTEIIQVVDFCLRIGLLQMELDYLTCYWLKERLKELIEKRERERSRDKPKDWKWKFVSVEFLPQEYTEMPQSKGKESKGKESKYTNEFEKFYNIYPRKIDKKSTYTKYLAILKNKEATVIQIENAAEMYRLETINTEARYIKHPTTRLNKWSWDNYNSINIREMLYKEMRDTRTIDEVDPWYYWQCMKQKYKLTMWDQWEDIWMEDKQNIKHEKKNILATNI